MIARHEASDRSKVLLPQILELQGEGLSSSTVSRRLGIKRHMVKLLARNAGSPFGGLQAYKRAKLAPPASKELLAALATTPPKCCMYIAADLHDSAARPCGESCCTTIVDGSEHQSSWCAEHHLVVYSNVDRGATRKITINVRGLAHWYTSGVH